MCNLHISPMATRDLKEIKEYISKDLENPAAATRLTGKIAKVIKGLKTMPDKGAPLSSIIEFETDYRFLVANDYLTFYRHIGNDVFVNRVLHSKRDYIKILFGEVSAGEANTQKSNK
ncbi:MAG: type II toxin-antitoxin system RelE/ParE family toxin [Oscillospiraceae bacterium]|nr:type II toxin-antitoxin system RelE/ParE family toxin [Oscillospiraceae bacterium]